jgi:hypothetical protein
MMKKLYVVVLSGITSFSVNAQAPSAFFSVSDTVICEGECVDFSDLSTNEPTSWLWTFSGASVETSSEQHPASICYSKAGNYSVSLTAGNIAGSQTIILRIKVREAIHVPVVSVVGVTLSTGTYSGYQWYFNGDPIASAQAPAFKARQNGNYAVEVTAANGCSAISLLTNVNNVGEELSVTDIRVFPNPSNGTLTINRGVSQPQVMEIVTADGKVLMMKTLNKIQETIDMHGYRNGTYFVRVHQDENVAVEQIKLEK